MSSGNDYSEPLNGIIADRIIEEADIIGVKKIFISGGEPLLFKNIYDLINSIKQHGIKTTLCTNATLLKPQVITKLKIAGLDGLSIGLESLDSNSYHRYRGRDNITEILQNIREAQEQSLKVSLDVTVTRLNRNELSNIINYCIQNKIDAFLKRFLPLGRGKTNQKQLQLSRIENKAILKLWAELFFEYRGIVKFYSHDPLFGVLIDQMAKVNNVILGENEKHPGCIAGKQWVGIAPDGNVMICPILARFVQLDNIREKSISEIFNNSMIFKNIRDRNCLKGSCKRCRYREECGGCRAAAYSVNGEIFGTDPMCSLFEG